jgi:hypothetical protein
MHNVSISCINATIVQKRLYEIEKYNNFIDSDKTVVIARYPS